MARFSRLFLDLPWIFDDFRVVFKLFITFFTCSEWPNVVQSALEVLGVVREGRLASQAQERDAEVDNGQP